MTLNGANIFNENNDNTIYTINSATNGQYCTIIPKNTDGSLSMLVDINMKADFDSLIANSITKEALIEKLNKEYDNIKKNYPTGILVIPMTDIDSLTNAVNSNDKQKVFDETKKIGGITSELYKNLTESGIDKSRINQKITIIEKNDIDTKFVEWLKEQMPNFVDGVKLESTEPTQLTDNNPFTSTNPFTGETKEVESTEEPIQQPEAPTTNDIFAEPTPVNPEPVVDSTPTTEETIKPTIETTTIPEPTPVNPEPVVEPTPEVPAQEPIQNTPAEPTATNNTVIEPSPVPEQKEVSPSEEINKKSGGFVNLLILLVVLAVVTVASIELGKFLFNTFGT